MDLDYEKIGLKSGLEIHQQLDSHKLYCNCPFLLRQDKPDFEIKRKLHIVAGESGEIDVAVKHEVDHGKEFVYQGYDSTCLVELDEEPPHEINKEALKIAMHISFLLNCKIIPISQIMRKTVIDGSNTSGFQRTVLIAREGFVETSKGRVGIWYVYLEEDAARIVGEDKDKKIYRLDRLGGPMVEVVTAPDIRDAEHAKETALKIGKILRNCKVKRGIGTIRQDINVSIKGHPRVEIKGFQDPKIFVSVVEKEVERQLSNLKNKKELKPEVRGANPDSSTRFLRPLPGSARMYPETDLPLLKISRQMINDAKKTLSVKIENAEEELKKEGLNKEMISLILKRGKLEDYKEFIHIIKNPQLIVKTLLIFPKEIASKEKKTIEQVEKILNRDILGNVLEDVKKGKILEHNVKNILEDIVHGESGEIDKIDESEIEEKILKIIKEKLGLSANAYMGLIMKEFRGKISGKEAAEIIKKHIQ